MKNARLITAAAALLLASSAASAQKQTTFSTAQTYQSCQDTWAFACGKRTPSGQIYGTAHKRKQCSTYTLFPDGSARINDYPGMWDKGRYRIRNGVVDIEVFDQKGKVVYSTQKRLSRDGKTLGDMTRIEKTKQ